MEEKILDELDTMSESLYADDNGEEVNSESSNESDEEVSSDNSTNESNEDDKDPNTSDDSDGSDKNEDEDEKGNDSDDSDDSDDSTNSGKEDDNKEDVIADLKKDIEDLRSVITSLTKTDSEDSTEDKKEEHKDSKSSEETTDYEFKEETFITEEDDLEEIFQDPEKLNSVLNKVLLKGIEIGESRRKTGDETVLRSIPDIVKKNVEVVTSLKKLSEQFYNDNKDLAPFKKVVSVVFEEMLAENPDKSYEEVLPDVAKESRKRLDLQKKATDKTKDKKTPRLPTKGSQRRKTNQPKTNSLISELDEMNESLNLNL